MEELLKTDFFSHSFDENKRMLLSVSLPETEVMTDKEYRENMTEVIALMDKHLPEYILVDLTQMRFTIAPDTQEWLQANMFPCYDRLPLNKLAFVVSQDFYAALSIEQTVENYTPSGYSVCYFDSKEEADTWFKEIYEV